MNANIFLLIIVFLSGTLFADVWLADEDGATSQQAGDVQSSEPLLGLGAGEPLESEGYSLEVTSDEKSTDEVELFTPADAKHKPFSFSGEAHATSGGDMNDLPEGSRFLPSGRVIAIGALLCCGGLLAARRLIL